jgi:hypothetical protein
VSPLSKTGECAVGRGNNAWGKCGFCEGSKECVVVWAAQANACSGPRTSSKSGSEGFAVRRKEKAASRPGAGQLHALSWRPHT